MDLFRETFSDRKGSGDLPPRSTSNHPEGFLFPQGNAPNDSAINPSKPLTQGGVEDFEGDQVYRGEVVDYLILKLWVEDLPGKKHAENNYSPLFSTTVPAVIRTRAAFLNQPNPLCHFKGRM